jgi:hypothetical protein
MSVIGFIVRMVVHVDKNLIQQEVLNVDVYLVLMEHYVKIG